jgi:alpha-galactosidase
MSRQQRDLVAEGVRVYKDIRAELPQAVPFWPLGLPRWDDSWSALGLRLPGASYVTVWHRGPLGVAIADHTGNAEPTGNADPTETLLPIPHLRGQAVTARILYPAAAGDCLTWDAGAGTLIVSLPRTPSACVLSLKPTPATDKTG